MHSATNAQHPKPTSASVNLLPLQSEGFSPSSSSSSMPWKDPRDSCLLVRRKQDARSGNNSWKVARSSRTVCTVFKMTSHALGSSTLAAHHTHSSMQRSTLVCHARQTPTARFGAAHSQLLGSRLGSHSFAGVLLPRWGQEAYPACVERPFA